MGMLAFAVSCESSSSDPVANPGGDTTITDTNTAYVAGYYNNGTYTIAAYWKNGVKTDLHTASRSEATGIFFANGNVYISGSYNMVGDADAGTLVAVPCYWVYNGSTVTKTDLSIGTEASGEDTAIFS